MDLVDVREEGAEVVGVREELQKAKEVFGGKRD